jgi:hypothetical protein
VAVDHRVQELLGQETGIRRSYLPLALNVTKTKPGRSARPR